MRQFWRVRGAATVSGVLLAALTLLGCGSSGTTTATTMNHAAPSSLVEVTLVPPAPSTTEVADGNGDGSVGDEDDPTEAILEAHRGFWDTWLAANDPPDPDHPGLRRYYTGAAYERAVAAIEKNVDGGLVIRLPDGSRYEHVASIVAFDGERAVVRDCAIDDAVIIAVASGAVINADVETQLLEATIELGGDGTWRVSDNIRVEAWPGITECA